MNTGVGRLALLGLALVAASGCADQAAIARATTISVSTASPDPGPQRDRDVAWIYHLAKTHATDDLVDRLDRERERLRDDAAAAGVSQPKNVLASEPPHTAPPIAVLSSPNASATSLATPAPSDPLAAVPQPQLDPAIVLALFHIDPATYGRLFVDNYPVTSEGVQHDFGDRLAKAKLTKTGEEYPIVELARAAATDDVAAAKLYTAAGVANGELADRYARVVAAFAKGHPDALLPMLVRLPLGVRLAIVSNPVGWCAMPPKAILAEAPEDESQLTIERDLRDTTQNCRAMIRAHELAMRSPDEPHPKSRLPRHGRPPVRHAAPHRLAVPPAKGA